MKTIRITFLCCLMFACALMPLQAHALNVKNLDYVSYALTVMDGGEIKKVTIPSRGVYRTPGPHVVVEMKGQKPIRTIGNAEVIIKDGKLHFQRWDSRPGR